jgi:hypothetical protein
MLWWIVDNLSIVLLVLGIAALCFAAAWWSTRKTQLLIGVGVPILLMPLAWLLSLFVVTDRMQLVRNIESMRDFVNAGKLDEALEFFENEVKVDTMQGELKVAKSEMKSVAKGNMKLYGVKKVDVWGIHVQDVSRPMATVNFYIKPQDSEERGRCRMGFVLGQDGKWRVSTFTVESLVGGKKSPLLLPF